MMKRHLLSYLRRKKNKILTRWLDKRIVCDSGFRESLHDRLLDESLKKYRDFDVANVPAGFAQQFKNVNDDTEILRRICRSYKSAKAKQATLGPEYRESDDWAPIYQSSLKSVMAALREEDVESLSKMYQNFWRDPCSMGLVGLPFDMETVYLGGKISERYAQIALRDNFWRLNLWQELVANQSISVLESPNIGNPYGFHVEGTFLAGGCDYKHYYATQVRRLLKLGERRAVAEVGGGFGGMAYYLLRDAPGVNYIDFDLPENMALTAYYLLTAFPEKRIFLYGEASPSELSPAEYDAMVLPSFMLAEQPSSSIDVMFNSYSLAEMSQDTVQKLVAEFRRTVRQYVLHVNHNRTSSVKADQFGLENAGFSLLYKFRALWNFARNHECDEYEYLYARRDS